MLSTDRQPFEDSLRELFAGLDKPLNESKINAFWKALANMSLLEFSRSVEFMLQEMASDADKAAEWGKRLVPSELWAAKRRMRARGMGGGNQQPDEKAWGGDPWDIRANLLLLGFINDQARAGVHYCCEETRLGARKATNPSEETKELTACLVAYKHAWAGDMREFEAEHGVHPSRDEQLRTFMDCMRRAAADAEQVREAYATELQEQAA